MVRDILRLIEIDEIIETGTFRGTSTEFFANVSGKRIRSVESNPRFHRYSTYRLAPYPEISVTLADSRVFLTELAAGHHLDGKTLFFYLDAHWHADLPLIEEVTIIAQTWPMAVIMIDDFQVPGDQGYGYDDYGPGRVLTEAGLPVTEIPDWSMLYPSVPSQEETGARRGSIVLCSPQLNLALRASQTMRGKTNVDKD